MSFRIVTGMLLLGIIPTSLFAQFRGSSPTKKRGLKIRTVVAVELLADKRTNGLTAQQWGQTFEKLGYRVRIRRALLDEKPETKERTRGSQRDVTVIGKLDRSGRLVFADRTFTQSQSSKLAEWLRSLEAYGAQGSPKGQPIWGLNKAQFDILYNGLSGKIVGEVQGRSLDEAITAMRLPERYPLQYTTAARQQLSQLGASRPPVRAPLQGLSKGTGLAIALSEFGLGFRPQRTPAGGLEIAIESKEKVPGVWPIGWDLKASRAKTAPQMFKLVPVELEKVKLVDALDGISTINDIPIHFDRFGIEAKGINVDEIVVSVPPKKTSWSLLLRSITTPYKLTRKFRIDENGKPFVWVTALVPKRPNE